jgi:hypothetical protein
MQVGARHLDCAPYIPAISPSQDWTVRPSYRHRQRSSVPRAHYCLITARPLLGTQDRPLQKPSSNLQPTKTSSWLQKLHGRSNLLQLHAAALHPAILPQPATSHPPDPDPPPSPANQVPQLYLEIYKMLLHAVTRCQNTTVACVTMPWHHVNHTIHCGVHCPVQQMCRSTPSTCQAQQLQLRPRRPSKCIPHPLSCM